RFLRTAQSEQSPVPGSAGQCPRAWPSIRRPPQIAVLASPALPRSPELHAEQRIVTAAAEQSSPKSLAKSEFTVVLQFHHGWPSAGLSGSGQPTGLFRGGGLEIGRCNWTLLSSLPSAGSSASDWREPLYACSTRPTNDTALRASHLHRTRMRAYRRRDCAPLRGSILRPGLAPRRI